MSNNISLNDDESLESMHEIMSTLLIEINNAKKRIQNNLDNTVLEEHNHIYSKIKKTFNSDLLDDLICQLSENNYIIEDILNNTCICEHEWVDDLIDIDPDTSKHICYCIKCEVTKL